MSPTSSRIAEFVFFGGKGGVGKTTCAASHAIVSARRGRVTLAISTDPAHSLGDALGVRLDAQPRVVAPRLSAVELDAPRAFRRWLKAHRSALADIVERGTWLDRADVDALLDLSVPGIDELVGLLEIVRLAEPSRTSRRAAYDLIVVDTAPTGHTLRLLAAPGTVGAVADVLDALHARHRFIRDRLAGGGRPEAADHLIALIAAEARTTGELLRDRSHTAFTWIALPEALSLAESQDGVAALTAAGIPVETILINRVLPDGPPCPNCTPRRAEERRVVAQAKRTLGRARRVQLVPAAPREPRGLRALASLTRSTRRIQSRRPARPAIPPLRPAGYRHLFDGARLVFFGGKGGVGKTTVAAAAALRVARSEPGRRVLLISTDPAHSVGDVLDIGTGHEPRAVPGAPANLRVQEVDARRALGVRRARLEAAIDQVAGALGRTGVAASGAAGMREMMDLAPPGIDELFSLLEIARVASSPDADVVVIDTAPTGHALRLLEMPALARDWVQLLMRMLLKYRELVPPGALGAELLELSQSITALQKRLTDPSAARFIIVARAAAVPRAETERLLKRLRRLRLYTPAMVVNALTLQPGRCPWCSAVAAAEQQELASLVGVCRRPPARCAIIRTPLAVPPPRGIAALERWAHTWIA